MSDKGQSVLVSNDENSRVVAPSGQDTGSRRNQRTEVLALLGLLAVLLVVGSVRYHFCDTPLERDEGEFAYGGQLILAGETPYTSLYAMKLPGIYVAYALIEATLGQSIRAIHLGLLVVNLSSIVLVYLLGRRLFDAPTGSIAAGVFAVLTLSPGVHGTQAQAEHFVVLAGLIGVLLLMSAGNQPAGWRIFGSGIAFGIAVLTKQHGLAFPLFGLLYVATIEPSRWVHDFKRMSAGLAMMLAGIALPWLLTCIVLAWAGAFDSFFFWTFTYPATYVSINPITKQFATCFNNVLEQLSYVGLLWGVAAIGVTTVLWFPQARRHRMCLLLLLACCVIGIMPGGYYRPHYFVLLAPPLALLAAIGMRALDVTYRAQGGGRILPIVMVLVAFSIPVWQLWAFYSPLTPNSLSRALYFGCPFPEAVELSRYLAAHSSTDDRIGVLGSEPEVFFYSRRRSATGHIYMYPLTEPHAFAQRLQQEVIRDIEATQPKFIVQCLHPSSWYSVKGADTTQFDAWKQQYLDRHYVTICVAETIGDRPTHYHWGEAARDLRFVGQRSTILLERRN